MVISNEIIARNINAIIGKVDDNKCDAHINATLDGLSIDIKTYDKNLCSIHIEVTPYVFDISAGPRFSEGDIRHEDFSFYDIAFSVIGGNAIIKSRPSLVFFAKPILEISLPKGRKFFMNYDGLLPLMHVEEIQYLSYLR